MNIFFHLHFFEIFYNDGQANEIRLDNNNTVRDEI